jgi:hypothetical protein
MLGDAPKAANFEEGHWPMRVERLDARLKEPADDILSSSPRMPTARAAQAPPQGSRRDNARGPLLTIFSPQLAKSSPCRHFGRVKISGNSANFPGSAKDDAVGILFARTPRAVDNLCAAR